MMPRPRSPKRTGPLFPSRTPCRSGNRRAAGEAAAALGGAFPGGKPAEEALGLGLGKQAIAAGAALPRRLGVQHVQPAEIDLVLGADRLGPGGNGKGEGGTYSNDGRPERSA